MQTEFSYDFFAGILRVNAIIYKAYRPVHETTVRSYFFSKQ